MCQPHSGLNVLCISFSHDFVPQLQYSNVSWDMDTAVSMAEALLPYRETDFPVIWSFPPLFFRALVWYELAQQTRKRRYVRLARRETKTMAQWVKWGFTNCHHMYLLLLAEKAMLEGDKDKVKGAYGT